MTIAAITCIVGVVFIGWAAVWVATKGTFEA
jgi:hypothetical protein